MVDVPPRNAAVGLQPPVPVVDADACDIEEFRALVATPTSIDDYPHAAAIDHGAVVYDLTGRDNPSADPALRVELAAALSTGPGIVVVKTSFTADVIDRASSS